jgi:hypothetical protein
VRGVVNAPARAQVSPGGPQGSATNAMATGGDVAAGVAAGGACREGCGADWSGLSKSAVAQHEPAESRAGPGGARWSSKRGFQPVGRLEKTLGRCTQVAASPPNMPCDNKDLKHANKDVIQRGSAATLSGVDSDS